LQAVGGREWIHRKISGCRREKCVNGELGRESIKDKSREQQTGPGRKKQSMSYPARLVCAKHTTSNFYECWFVVTLSKFWYITLSSVARMHAACTTTVSCIHQLPFTNYLSPTTYHQLPFTNYHSTCKPSSPTRFSNFFSVLIIKSHCILTVQAALALQAHKQLLPKHLWVLW